MTTHPKTVPTTLTIDELIALRRQKEVLEAKLLRSSEEQSSFLRATMIAALYGMLPAVHERYPELVELYRMHIGNMNSDMFRIHVPPTNAELDAMQKKFYAAQERLTNEERQALWNA